MQFARRHQAARDCQSAENHLAAQHRHFERRYIRAAKVILGCANQRDAKRAECMAERRPLRHRRHLHQTERNTDRRADSQCDKNPAVADGDVLELAFDPEL